MEKMVYWIWLSLSVTPGSTTFSRLIKDYSDPYEIYLLREKEYRRLIASKSSDIGRLCNKDLSEAERIYKFCTDKGVGILEYSSDNYPASLKAISNPPVLLYYRGSLPDFNNNFFISIVGTRRLTDYGRKNAYSISYDLARAGAIVVSGMAIGIDGVAMAGAISAGGTTVAVIGSGIDVCYPEAHKRLAREIVKNGCVLTEYAPGTRPFGKNFPIRNRIIAGLSAATLVIEGREGSGAIITARHAKSQNRAVYALPGNVDNETSAVSNLLIQNGAGLVMSAEDIISDYEFKYPGKLNPYNLLDKPEYNMRNTLLSLEISCVAPSDSFFRASSSKDTRRSTSTQNSSANENVHDKYDASNDSVNNQKKEESLADFDKDMLALYKRIPVGEEISVDELVSDEYNMRDIMRIITKLEMHKFVILLPSGKVKRYLA